MEDKWNNKINNQHAVEKDQLQQVIEPVTIDGAMCKVTKNPVMDDIWTHLQLTDLWVDRCTRRE